MLGKVRLPGRRVGPPLHTSHQPLDHRLSQLPPPPVGHREVVDRVIGIRAAEHFQEIPAALAVGALEVGKPLIADVETGAVVSLVSGSRVIDLNVGRDRQPGGQEFGLLLVKGVLPFGQDSAELTGGDVDAQLVQLFPKQRLRDMLMMILMDDERDQRRSEVTVGQDIGRQFGDPVLAVGSQPAFATVTDDPRTNDEILNHEVFVTFEDRTGWPLGQRNQDVLGNDQLRGLGPLG